MINAGQNSSGGSPLGSMYIDQRILGSDPFYVYIAP
jgi:hypothetical protein